MFTHLVAFLAAITDMMVCDVTNAGVSVIAVGLSRLLRASPTELIQQLQTGSSWYKCNNQPGEPYSYYTYTCIVTSQTIMPTIGSKSTLFPADRSVTSTYVPTIAHISTQYSTHRKGLAKAHPNKYIMSQPQLR